MSGAQGFTSNPNAAPQTLQLLGSNPPKNTADIRGEYVHAGIYEGKAYYRQVHRGIVIRWNSQTRRWLVDVGGQRDAWDTYAYSDQPVDSIHPGNIKAVWKVRHAGEQAFRTDTDIAVVDVPRQLVWAGKDFAETSYFELCGLFEGKARYTNGAFTLQYFSQYRRWVVQDSQNPDMFWCLADYDGDCPHPANPVLVWAVPNKFNSWALDPEVKMLWAPLRIHLVGNIAALHRLGHPADYQGTYQLEGTRDGKPKYVHNTERDMYFSFSAAHDRWQLQTSGMAKEGMLRKLLRWVWTGTTSGEQCIAWARADGMEYPGPCLKWQVFSRRKSDFVEFPWMCATSAPVAVQVQGVDPHESLGSIRGMYYIHTAAGGYPAYKQEYGPAVIRFEEKHGHWVIDSCGNLEGDTCAAYLDGLCQAGHPAAVGRWHAYSQPRGLFFPHERMQCVMCANAPEIMPKLIAPTVAPEKRRRELSSPAPVATKRVRTCDYAGA